VKANGDGIRCGMPAGGQEAIRHYRIDADVFCVIPEVWDPKRGSGLLHGAALTPYLAHRFSRPREQDMTAGLRDSEGYPTSTTHPHFSWN